MIQGKSQKMKILAIDSAIFVQKQWSSQTIFLKKGDTIIFDNTEIASILNNHFVCAAHSLTQAGGGSEQVSDYITSKYPVENVVHRFKHHPTIIAINNRKFENMFVMFIVYVSNKTCVSNGLIYCVDLLYGIPYPKSRSWSHDLRD